MPTATGAPTGPSADAVELPIVSETLDKIDKEMAKLEEAVTRYNAYRDVRARLTGSNGASAPAISRPATTRSGPRSKPGAEYQRFIDAVQADPGKMIPEYARVLGKEPGYLYKLVRKGVGEGLIREEVQSDGRTKNIFPVTDADRIASRAAELEAASKS